MKMRLTLLSLASCILLCACSTNPYGTGKNQGYFLGPATITSNTSNICTDSNGQYAFKGTQTWLAGGQGTSWYTCTANRSMNFSPEYSVSYSIIKNDGTGKNVVSTCTPYYKGPAKKFSQMNVMVQLNSGKPTCQANLS
ncbi:MAG: hypothetical protein K0Q57_834 [Gammaproteobacteria bacterium]|jgi:hypothetical protein|nr:hypothetical protein [Gammaproteobacteria bacterium]